MRIFDYVPHITWYDNNGFLHRSYLQESAEVLPQAMTYTHVSLIAREEYLLIFLCTENQQGYITSYLNHPALNSVLEQAKLYYGAIPLSKLAELLLIIEQDLARTNVKFDAEHVIYTISQ